MSAESGKVQPVGFCSLTESGRLEYCDGKPMFMAGPVGNYLHPVALYPHPDPVRAALVEALDPQTLEAIADEIGSAEHSARAESLRGIARRQRAALRAAGVELS